MLGGTVNLKSPTLRIPPPSGGGGCQSYRRWDKLGSRLLVVFAAILGFGGVLTGLVGLTFGAVPDEPAMPLWTQMAFFAWAIAIIPWLLFALQYTGHYTTIRWRTVGVLYAPFVGFIFSIAHNISGIGGAGIVDAITSVVFIYCFALAFIGAFLVVQSTYSYVHLSLRQGIALATAPIVVVIAVNSVVMIQSTSVHLAVGQYALAFAIGTGALGIVLVRESVLDWTPAAETLGERAIARETDDLIFVVDADDCVIKCNGTVTKTLATSKDDVLRKPIVETLGENTETLAEVETISLATKTGQREYDPQVSTITVDHSTVLGAVVSLRDVTSRELREQRLAVLNRVLRHNLRNKIEVVKSHAEVLSDQRNGEHVGAIMDTADEITQLGYTARDVDQFLSDSAGTQRVDLLETIETTVSKHRPISPDVSVTLNLPEADTVETHRLALESALDSAIENAIKYADSTVEITATDTGAAYKLSVADDGPGIPEGELDSLDAGTETPLQHGTGLGLWQLKWAVTTLGGELSFDTSEGTTVVFTVPDRE